MLRWLYEKKLMDHYRNSPYRGTIAHPDFLSETHNPSCGDIVSVAGMRNGAVITKLAFEGRGCVVSQAAASILCEVFEGKSVDELMQTNAEQLQQLLGVSLGPVRMKCALLGLTALKQALQTKES